MKWLIVFLLIQYTVLALGYFLNSNYPQMLYWIGVTVLTFGVLLMS